MKKFMILILAVLALTLVLSGCGGSGGGGGDDTPKSVTAYFHFNDQATGNGIAGVKLVYIDPSGSQITTEASDSNGNIAVTVNKAGDYTIISYQYEGDHSLDNPYTLSVKPEDIAGNKKTDIYVEINADSKEITDLNKIDRSGDGSTPAAVTAYFHFIISDSGDPIVGLKVGYHFNANTTLLTTPASDSNGNITLAITKAGTYTVTKAYYESKEFDVTGIAKDVSSDDISNNKKVRFTVPIIVVDAANHVYDIDEDNIKEETL